MRLFLLILLSFTMLKAADPQPAGSADPVAKPAWASAMGKDTYGTWADLEVKGVTQRFRLIPAGSFTMGCDAAEAEEAWSFFKRFPLGPPLSYFAAPQHVVSLSTPFWLADSACTQELWEAVMEQNPSFYHGDARLPVEKVSCPDCLAFAERLTSLLPAAHIRLPTESEWEYSCRAGSLGKYHGASLDDIAWHQDNSGYVTHPVKRKTPNAWGLYDMLGNVMQWCSDWSADYPSGAVSDPSGPGSGSKRVSRGSHCGSMLPYNRSAFRYALLPDSRYEFQGFRLCISAQPGTSP
jgi:formylglycine-generating enzyme required for sulfatase activity